MKAIGTGLSSGVSWHDVATHTHSSGQPQLIVTGRAAEVSAGLGVTRWLVSLSHTRELAMASVMAIGDAVGASQRVL